MSRCSICNAPKVLCTCKDEAEIVGIEEVKHQYEKDCRVGYKELDEVCCDCGDFLNHKCVECEDCPVNRLKKRIRK